MTKTASRAPRTTAAVVPRPTPFLVGWAVDAPVVWVVNVEVATVPDENRFEGADAVVGRVLGKDTVAGSRALVSPSTLDRAGVKAVLRPAT